MRKLNLVFLACLVAALSLLAVGSYFLHEFQTQRNATALLQRAQKLEAEGEQAKASGVLRQYLTIRKDDTETWKKFAETMDRLTADAKGSRVRERALFICQEALRHNPGDRGLERRCLDLAVEFGRNHINDAKTHLRTLLSAIESDEQKKAERAELREIEGNCLAIESKFEDARKSYEQAIELDPARVSAYVRLAQLQRTQLRTDIKSADDEIDRMVSLNPESGLAHLYRYQYDRDFEASGRTPRRSDLEQAIRLSPENVDVLLAAAADCQEKKQIAEARAFLEKGLKLHPERLEFLDRLTRLETDQGRFEQAEELLRDAYRRKPSALVAFSLASVLITRNKASDVDEIQGLVANLKGQGGGVGEGFARILGARIKMQQGKWLEAVTDIESAQAVFKSAGPAMMGQLDLMLAECYRRGGVDERRLAALQNAVEGGARSEATQFELAMALLRSDGPSEQERAMTILRELAVAQPELEIEIARVIMRNVLRQPRDLRDWKDFNDQLVRADARLKGGDASAQARDKLVLLRADQLVARGSAGDIEQARTLLENAQSGDPTNPSYPVARARLAMRREGGTDEALKILDQAEKKLGPNPAFQFARMDLWSILGGDRARAEVARLAEARTRVPEADRPLYLEKLAQTEMRLGLVKAARQHFNELAALRPTNLSVLVALFDLALQDGDRVDAGNLIRRIYLVENPSAEEASKEPHALAPGGKAKGTYWRYAQAAFWISQEISRKKAGDQGAPSAPETGQSAMEKAQALAQEIEARRPMWWGGPALKGQIALLTGQSEKGPNDPSVDEAIEQYQRAVDRGDVRPTSIQQLIQLLALKNRHDDIDKVVSRLRDQEHAPAMLKVAAAIAAIRKQDYRRAIALARETYDASANYSDHLFLARLYEAAAPLAADSRAPQEEVAQLRSAAGREYQRAVELGRGVSDTWLKYVQYLVRAGNLVEARKAVAAAREALPADRAVTVLASCYLLIGDLQQADSLVRQALKTKPNDPSILRFAADFAFQLGRLDEVKKLLDTIDGVAPGASPGDPGWGARTRAKLLLASGRTADWPQAERLVDGNLNANPRSVPDLVLKAGILAGQPKPASQQAAIKILEDLDRQSSLGPSDQFLLARLLLAAGESKRYQDQMLKILVTGNSTSPPFLAHYISYLLREKQINQATHWVEELARAHPGNQATLELQARLLSESGDKQPAALRQLLVERAKAHPELTLTSARLLALHGFPTEAEAAYREHVVREPARPERELALASFLATREGRASEALEMFSRLWKTCPPEQVALASLALYDAPSVTDAQRKQVEAWVTEARQKRPDLPVLSIRLAVLWIRTSRFDEAEAMYRQILASTPDNPEALNNLAWLLALRDDPKVEEARERIDHAIRLRGEIPSLMDTRAVVLIRARRLNEAIEELKKAEQRDPKNSSLPLHLAWAQNVSGRKADAQEAFRRACSLGWSPEKSDPLERAHIDKLRKELGL